MRTLLSLSFVALVLCTAACSSSSSSSSAPCNTQPFTCAAGTTCWPADNAADFACLKSGGGKAGDTCQNTPSTATCGDGLMCLQLTTTEGHCVPYCDTAHVCPTGQACTAAQLVGTSVITHVCFGGTSTSDAGADAAHPADAAAE